MLYADPGTAIIRGKHKSPNDMKLQLDPNSSKPLHQQACLLYTSDAADEH